MLLNREISLNRNNVSLANLDFLGDTTVCSDAERSVPELDGYPYN